VQQAVRVALPAKCYMSCAQLSKQRTEMSVMRGTLINFVLKFRFKIQQSFRREKKTPGKSLRF